MCWLSGSLTCRLPNVMRSPPARRSRKFSHCWLILAPRRWGFYLKSKSTNYPDHGHRGDPPPTRKIPMVEPGIAPGTSWLVVRRLKHMTTLPVTYLMNAVHLILGHPLLVQRLAAVQEGQFLYQLKWGKIRTLLFRGAIYLIGSVGAHVVR